ncbi:MAG: hypothetical protein GY838_12780 [bacterium]|nr:hypothetical protein [bacterium]
MRIWQRRGKAGGSAAGAIWVKITNGVVNALLSAADTARATTDIVLSTQHLDETGAPLKSLASLAQAGFVRLSNGTIEALLSAANTARSATDVVLSTQHLGSDGQAQPSGADADAPVFMQLLAMMASIQGPGVYKSPYHFTAVYQAATGLDFSGHPAITDATQIVMVLQMSSAGVVTVHNPELSTGAFSWDAVNDRLTVTGATFSNTDIFGVVVQAADRYADDPGNFKRMAEVSHFPTKGDDAGVPLITAAQDFTAGWVDIGPELDLLYISLLETFWTVDINDSEDLQFRLATKHESGGTEEYPAIIATPGVSDIQFQPGYDELAVDSDALVPLTFRLSGGAPVGQLQVKAGTLGAGTDAQVDAAYYIRSTFGG